MDPRFKASFIPKKPMGVNAGVRGRIDVVAFAVNSIFAVSVLASLATVGYTYWLNGRIALAREQAVAAAQAVDLDLLNELRLLDKRLKAVGSIMNRHVAVVPLFELLEESTLSDVRYTNFDFKSGREDGVSDLVLMGEAQDLSSIVAQAISYESLSDLISPALNEINQAEDQNATFRMKASLSSALLLYKK